MWPRSVAAFVVLSVLTWAIRSLMGFTLLVGLAVLGWYMAWDDAPPEGAATAAEQPTMLQDRLTLAKAPEPEEQPLAAAASSGPASFAESNYKRLLSEVGKEPTKESICLRL